MKTFIIRILFLTTFVFVMISCGKRGFISKTENINPLNIGYKYDITIIDYDNEGVLLSINNNTEDTLYVFSSYFEFSTSSYLHRYDDLKREKMLSFIPMPALLTFSLSDIIIIGEHKVANFGQIKMKFDRISPESQFTFRIPKEAITTNDYVKYNPMDYQTPHFSDIKFKKVKTRSDMETITVQIAVYTDNIELLESKHHFWNNRLEYIKELSKANILSIEIPINYNFNSSLKN